MDDGDHALEVTESRVEWLGRFKVRVRERRISGAFRSISHPGVNEGLDGRVAVALRGRETS